jgi:NAD(P)-dependent dehydrogenase (short-subunit alcohol dehydrogenase family)
MPTDVTAMRHIVVTGATSGLGRALALDYAAAGTRLGLIGRNAVRLDQVARACLEKGATTVTGQIDVRDAEPLAAWLAAFDDAGPVDLVIAAAGISAGPPPSTAIEPGGLAQRQIRTNLLGCTHTIEPLLPRMLPRRAGQIAVVSSVAGYRGLPYSPAYSASKAGVRAYGEALRALLKPYGISVSVVVPGFFDSPMTDRFHGGKPFMLSLDRARAIVRRGLDRRQSRIVFPRLLALGLQVADLLPAWAGDEILRAVRFHIVPPELA